jgi:redox-sensitive bicupin YhaK (pirin superfamily)
MVEPHFKMMWRNQVPRVEMRDEQGRTTQVIVVAGRLGEADPPAPPPESWASRADAHVAIWIVRMEPGAQFSIPPSAAGVNRTLFFHRGASIRVGGREVPAQRAIDLLGDVEAPIENGAEPAELLLLQGRPIAEPVAQHGPFVMNTREEIVQAFDDYQRTRFGGWPWPSDGPVHARDEGPFARYPDGRIERPSTS